MKYLLIICLFFISLNAFSQKLKYISNGNIMNDKLEMISPNLVRGLLDNNEKLLKEYNSGRTKKTAGNILLYGGLGFLVLDIVLGISADVEFPTPLTYIGLGAIAISIPIKIGYSKKIRNVVTEYNNQSATGYNKPKLDLINNSNGIGLRLTLN